MSSNLASSSKLMYYPTHQFETYRMLGLLGKITIPYEQIKEIRDTVITKSQDDEFKLISINKDIDYSLVLYDYWVNTSQHELIKKYCSIRYTYSQNITVADLFAGEGNWLFTFKSFIPTCNTITLVANEIEFNRFNKIQADFKYNLAFEDLELPKYSISLMLFNPPYGSTNNVRNVKYYLQEIIDKKLLSHTGKLIGVIRKDDFLDSLDILCQYFDINNKCVYKVNAEEYSKYKQFVFIAKLKKYPYDLKSIHYTQLYQAEYTSLQRIINSDPEFDFSMYSNYRTFIWDYPSCDFSNLTSNLMDSKKYNYISSNNKNWKWIKEFTEIKDSSLQKLTIPLNPKTETLANIIASGYINGQVDNHIVVGGTKIVEETEVLDDKIKSVRLSKPYLNILYSHNNELKYKQLISDNE